MVVSSSFSLPNSTSVDQPFVLLVDDMDLVSKQENEVAWKSMITREHLNELYLIITRAGGSSYRPDNIWLTKHGKFAFVDTEYPKNNFITIAFPLTCRLKCAKLPG